MGALRCIPRIDQRGAADAYRCIVVIQSFPFLRHVTFAEGTSDSLREELLLLADVRLAIGAVLVTMTMHSKCATNDACGIAK